MTDNILALIAASASIALAPIRYDGYYSNRTRMSAFGREADMDVLCCTL